MSESYVPNASTFCTMACVVPATRHTRMHARTRTKSTCVPRTCTCTHVCAHTCKHTDARAAAVKHMQHRCDPIRVAPGRFRKSLTTAVSSCSWTCTVKSQCAAWYSSYSLISAACSVRVLLTECERKRIGSDRIESNRQPYYSTLSAHSAQPAYMGGRLVGSSRTAQSAPHRQHRTAPHRIVLVVLAVTP